MIVPPPIVQICASFLSAVILSSCATTAIDVNNDAINRYATSNIGAPAQWHKNSREQADARNLALSLLQKPLASDDAVRLALALSPAFQAMLSEAAAMSAMATQSARLSNPLFTFDRLTRKEGGAVDIDIGRMLSVSILELINLPSRLRAAKLMQTSAQLRGISSVVETASMTRQAWVRAVAAQQSLTYFAQVMDAADASAELAKRMYIGGNFSRLQRARQQVFYADATAQLAKAKQNALGTREALVRVIGLDTALAAHLQLPARLPDLPKLPKAEADIAQAAINQRIDVQMAAGDLKLLAIQYGFTKATSFVNVFHLGGINNSETGRANQRGYELELSIPIFDWGDANRGRAQAQYFAAIERLRQTTIDAESNVREQYAGYKTAYELTNHYRDEIVPLRKIIADEMQLKYNGMLASVFDLLAETRLQINSVILAIDAERDFWLADAALQASLLGKPTSGVRMDAMMGMDGGGGGAGH